MRFSFQNFNLISHVFLKKMTSRKSQNRILEWRPWAGGDVNPHGIWLFTLISWKNRLHETGGLQNKKVHILKWRNISKIGNVILKIFMRTKNWSQAWCWSPSQHKEWNLVRIALDRQIKGVLKERQESALTEKFTHNEEFIDSLGKTRWICDNSE